MSRLLLVSIVIALKRVPAQPSDDSLPSMDHFSRVRRSGLRLSGASFRHDSRDGFPLVGWENDVQPFASVTLITMKL
jgi:hypothetical protein